MFQSLWNWTKGVLSKMGLIKKLKNVTDHKQIPVDESFYNLILKWRALYQGYYDKIHDLTYRTIDGEKKRRLATLNMSKAAAQELATLIFNERCEISISDKVFNDSVQEVFKNNAFSSNFQQYLEFMFAMGGMVVKPYVKNKELQLSYVTADCFLPIAWTNSRVTEGVFVSDITKGDKKYTHLEWHTFEGAQYVIKNELYESNNNTNDLGVKVALSTLFPDLQEEVRINNVTRPLFAYFKPNLANNFDTTIPLGVSVFSNAIDTIKSINISFDSFQREFRLGRKRIIVPSSSIRTVIDPKTGVEHRYFDATDETYEAFDTGNMDDNKITEINSVLRVTEHIAAINALLNLFAMQIGFSAGAFSFDGQSVKTATEVVSENSKTFRTKQSHENVIEQGLADLIDCIGVVAELYGLFSRPKDYEVTVQFDDSIAEDQTAEINKQVLLITNKLQSRKRAIMKIYGLTEEEAQQLLDEINTESIDETALIDFFGTNKNNKSDNTDNNGDTGGDS